MISNATTADKIGPSQVMKGMDCGYAWGWGSWDKKQCHPMTCLIVSERKQEYALGETHKKTKSMTDESLLLLLGKLSHQNQP